LAGRFIPFGYKCRGKTDQWTAFVSEKFCLWRWRNKTNEGLRERTKHLDIFLFSTHHSMAFYFRYSVYWWKGSVRF